MNLNSSDNKINDNNSNINIIQVKFKNVIVETTYEIALDNAFKSIVTKIHGSWSLEDCVINAMPDPTSLEKVTLCECS